METFQYHSPKASTSLFRVLAWAILAFFPGLVLLAQDGSIDESFALASATPGLSRVALQSNGKILVGGDFATFGTNPAAYFARLNPDGKFDTNFFTGTGFSWNPGARQFAVLLVQPDDKILVGGNFTGAQGFNQPNLLRLLPNGQVDTTFTPIIGGPVTAVELGTNGFIYVAGSFTNAYELMVNNLAVLNPDGTLESAFRTRQTPFIGHDVNPWFGFLPKPPGSSPVFHDAVTRGTISALKLLNNGDIVVGGTFPIVTLLGTAPPFSAGSSYNSQMLMVLHIENPFFSYAIAQYSQLYGVIPAIATKSDGTVIVGGPQATGLFFLTPTLAKLAGLFGSEDRFQVRKIIVQADDKILVGVNNLKTGIVRVFSNGAPDPSFSSPLVKVNEGFADMAIQADGKILIVGTNLTANGQSVSILRLNNQLPTSLSPKLSYTFDDAAKTVLKFDWAAGLVLQQSATNSLGGWSDLATNSPAYFPVSSGRSFFRLIKRP